MEILNSYHTDKEGNECLIIESIALIRVTYGFYIVIHATQAIGGWTGNPVKTRNWNFCSYNEAVAHFNQLYEQIK